MKPNRNNGTPKYDPNSIRHSLPTPKGVDTISKRFAAKQGEMILDLIEYLRAELGIRWDVGPSISIRSIKFEENMKNATLGDAYIMITLHREPKANYNNEIAFIGLRMDAKSFVVWDVLHMGGNLREWNKYNPLFTDKDDNSKVKQAIIKFLKSRGMYKLKYNLNGSHPELPEPFSIS